MRRSPFTRTLSAVFAIWLALVTGESGFVHHHCPMHDRAATAQSGRVTGPHAKHHAHGDERGRDGAPTGHHAHLCTCIGACSASATATTLVDPPTLAPPMIGYLETAPPARSGATIVPTRVDFALPFSNGPPSAIA